VVGIDDVRRALEETRGEKKAAAGKLGISRQRLYRFLEAADGDLDRSLRASGAMISGRVADRV
jgi:DNA-binding NtrC family response regulator